MHVLYLIAYFLQTINQRHLRMTNHLLTTLRPVRAAPKKEGVLSGLSVFKEERRTRTYGVYAKDETGRRKDET